MDQEWNTDIQVKQQVCCGKQSRKGNGQSEVHRQGDDHDHSACKHELYGDDQEDHCHSRSDKDSAGECHESFGGQDDCEVEEECGGNRISVPVFYVQQV